MGVDRQIVEKSGAWYAYNGEKIGQGKDNAREFLRENPALAGEIENKMRESLGVPLLPGGRGAGRQRARPTRPSRSRCRHARVTQRRSPHARARSC